MQPPAAPLNYGSRPTWYRRGRVRLGAVVVMALAVAVASKGWWPPVVLAPWSPNATMNADGHVVISWHDAAGEEYYEIERKRGNGSYEPWASFEANTSSTLDQSVWGGVTYAYRIRATNSNGSSRYWREANISIALTAPRDFSATLSHVPVGSYDYPLGASEVYLTWSNTVQSEHMLLQRSTDGVNFDWEVRVPGTVYDNDGDYTDYSVSGPGPFYYRVQAYDASLRPIGPYASATAKAPPDSGDGP